MSRRGWSITGVAIAVVVLAAGVLWWQLPRLAQWYVVRQLESTANRDVTIARFDFDLLRGRLDIGGLRVADRAGGPPLAEIDELDARFQPLSLARGHLHVHTADVRGVRVHIARSERGELSIADLFSRPPGGGASAFTIDRLALKEGTLAIEDRAQAPPRTWQADAITVEATGISTSAEARGALRLSASVAGAPLSADLSSLALVPLRADARVTLRDVDATVGQLALPATAPMVLSRILVTADLSGALDGGVVKLGGRGALRDIAMAGRGGDAPVAQVPELTFAVDDAVAGGDVTRVGRVDAQGSAVLLDQRTNPATRYPIHRLGLTVETPPGDGAAPARVSFVAAREGGGQVDVTGTARFAPLAAELRARATRIDLSVWEALVPLPGRLSGFAEGDLAITVAASPSGPGVRVRGRAAASRLAIADRDHPLIAAQDLEVTGLDAEWPRLRVERIRAVRPTVAAERDAEGRLSLMALVPPAGPPRPDASGGAGTSPRLAIEIGEIALTDGTVTLDDAAVAPAVRLRFAPVSFSAREIAWPGNRPAKIEFKAGMPVTGTFEANGTATLDPVTVNLRARLAGAALGPYQVYSPLAARIRGRLDADVDVTGALEPRIDVGLRGTAGVRELTIGERDRPLITVARIDMTGLDYKWPTTIGVDRLRVERSWGLLERRADGSFPLAALFKPLPAGAAEAEGRARPAPGTGPAPAFEVTVRESLLDGGAVTVVDGAVSPPVRLELAGARLEARDFNWPARRPVPLLVHVPMPGGGSVGGEGQLGVGAQSVEMKVVVAGVEVAPAAAYLPVRGRVAGKAGAELDVKMTLEPFAVSAQGKAELRDVALSDGNRRVVAATRIETSGVEYAWPARVKVTRVAVERPGVAVERRRDGTLPLVAMLARPAAPAASGAPAPSSGAAPAIDVAVQEATVSAGSVSIVDRTVTPPARFEVGDLQFTAQDVGWPARGRVPLRFGASVPGGGRVTAQGELAGDAQRLQLAVALRDVALASVHPYLPLRGTLGGRGGGDFDVQVTLEPFGITARGSASAESLSVSDGGRAIAKVPRAELAGIAYAWPAKVEVERLRVQGSWVLAERARDGTLALGSLLAPAPAPPSSRTGSRAAPRTRPVSTAPVGPAVSPEVVVKQVVFEDMGATIVDASVSPPTRLEITKANLSVRDLDWPARTPATVDLRVPMPGGGSVAASGQIRADTSAIDLKLSLKQADLAVVAPYLPLKARVTGKADGDVAVKGTLQPLAVVVNGNLTLQWVVVADGQRMVAYVKQADLAGIQVDWPRRVQLDRIRVLEPWALVEREADGSIPLLALVAPGDAGVTAGAGGARPVASATPEKPPAIDVGAAIVEEGFIRFVDRTTSPAFAEEVSRLNSTARRLSSAPDARSPFTLTGQLTGAAPFNLAGTVGPVLGPLWLEVKGKVENLALGRMNPYLGHYFGWVARRGALSVTVDYRIENDRLDAKNEVVVSSADIAPSRRGEQLREKVGVPVDTLVSLLKNARGEVKMSVPVTGIVSARQFDFGDAVWEGVRKTVINVLALPVSWVGKVIYTEDARIDTIQIWPVTFEPGTIEVRRDIAAQVDRLATFLRDAPGIALTMKPVVTGEDVAALTQAAVRQRIETRAREAAEPVDAAAKRLFAERFPDRPMPETVDAIVQELAKAEDLPQDALNALAKSRVDLLQKELVTRAGVDAARLRASEGIVPVESTGRGRVEFAIAS